MILPTKDNLTISGMEFMACHGCLPEEKINPQLFSVDLSAGLSLEKAGKTDDISHTADYPAIYAAVEKIMAGESVKLIETLAERVALAVLSGFPIVESVKVTVHKPQSPLMGKIKDVSVTVFRERST